MGVGYRDKPRVQIPKQIRPDVQYQQLDSAKAHDGLCPNV